MLRNYLKASVRNLTRNMLYTILNIVGLVLGLALVTAGSQALKAAIADPVVTLRHE